jgi:hypothetical protein
MRRISRRLRMTPEMVRPERFELEALCRREAERQRGREPAAEILSVLCEGSPAAYERQQRWCALRDSNLRRFAGWEPAAEILSVSMRRISRRLRAKANMVRPERFELPTFWFVARRSIQLS